MSGVGPKALALGHPDMRMATTNPVPLFSMRTDYDPFPGDFRGMGNGIPVALSRLDAASAAGIPGPPGSPAFRRMDHIARDNVGGPNGSHSLANPTSTPPMAAKSTGPLTCSRAIEELKKHMQGGRG